MALIAVRQIVDRILSGTLTMMVGAAGPATLLAQAPAGGTSTPSASRSSFLSNPTALGGSTPEINVTGLTPPPGRGDGNLAAPFYGNPLSVAMPGGPGSRTFYTPLFANLPAAATAGLAGTGSALGANRLLAETNFGSSLGIRRAPTFLASLEFPNQPISPASLQPELQEILARSTSLSAPRKIQVEVQGRNVVLRGEVASKKESRLAEGLVRLAPGVQEVHNQLEVKGP